MLVRHNGMVVLRVLILVCRERQRFTELGDKLGEIHSKSNAQIVQKLTVNYSSQHPIQSSKNIDSKSLEKRKHSLLDRVVTFLRVHCCSQRCLIASSNTRMLRHLFLKP